MKNLILSILITIGILLGIILLILGYYIILLVGIPITIFILVKIAMEVNDEYKKVIEEPVEGKRRKIYSRKVYASEVNKEKKYKSEMHRAFGIQKNEGE